MRRVIVLGGLGLFGRTAAEQLRQLGVTVLIASRRGGGQAAQMGEAVTAHGVCLLQSAALRVDANDPASIRSVLRAGDVVVDAAGPFYARSTALIETAIEVGFDVVDINDDLRYAETVVALEPRIKAAGIRVLSSASSVSAVSAAVVTYSGVAVPRRVSTFLAPASRHTANVGTALSLLRSVGEPVRLYREGRLQSRLGWSEPRRFPMSRPVGSICGRLFESADAIYLPRIWPTLREVAMYVDSNTLGVNTLLRAAAQSSLVRTFLQTGVRLGTWMARKFGSSAGGIGYEIEGADGRVARYSIVSARNSYIVAVAPAVLAVQAIANDRFRERGLIMPDRHVEPEALFAFLAAKGLELGEVTP